MALNSGDSYGTSGMLGNVKVARTITVNSGAALSFTATNQRNSLGPVTRVGGTINTLGGYSSSCGGFGLRGTVTALVGSATATLASPSNANSFHN